MSKSHEELCSDFLSEIEKAMRDHAWSYKKDAFAYQALVVTSAICGLLSLLLGATGYGLMAGALGGATTVASVLTQTLHCVKAQGWQDRMTSELASIRIQFLYEHRSAPAPEALADLAKQLRDLNIRMSKEWERILSSQSGGLNLMLGTSGRSSSA